jgi:hypothetical protein
MKKLDDINLTCSRSQLAHALDVSGSRIQQLVDEGVLLAPSERGRYVLIENVRRYIQHQRETGQVPEGRAAFTTARTKWMEERAAIAEFERLRLSRELAPISATGQIFSEICALTMNRMMSVAHEVARNHSKYKNERDLHAAIDAAVRAALEEMASFDARDVIKRAYRDYGRSGAPASHLVAPDEGDAAA